MHRREVLFKTLFALVVAGLLLPMMICIVMALAVLLDAMKDATGGWVLRYVAVVGGGLWVIDLVAIVFVQAIGSLVQADEGNRSAICDRQNDEDRQ
jgi:hypothetical protein